jgi:lariat debranching enzyme
MICAWSHNVKFVSTSNERTNDRRFFAQVGIVGCGHGELDKMYETLALIEKRENTKIDLLLCCGDFQVGSWLLRLVFTSCRSFQAVRNEPDLACMACPPRFRAMNTFYK